MPSIGTSGGTVITDEPRPKRSKCCALATTTLLPILPRALWWGFARVCGDPYVAQVLDVITHPAYRRRGIARQCMRGVLAHLQQSRYVSVTLTDSSGIAGFYQQSGLQRCRT